MTKERFYTWLDSRIESAKGSILLDDGGEEFAVDCAAYRDKIHIFRLLEICKKLDISAKITLFRDDHEYPAEISFEYHGFKVFDLLNKEELPHGLKT